MPFPEYLKNHPDAMIGRTDSERDQDIRQLLVSQFNLPELRAAAALRETIPKDKWDQFLASGEIILDETAKITTHDERDDESFDGRVGRLLTPNCFIRPRVALLINGEWRSTCIMVLERGLPAHDIVITLYLHFLADSVVFKEKFKQEIVANREIVRAANPDELTINNITYDLLDNPNNRGIVQYVGRRVQLTLFGTINHYLRTVKYFIESPIGLFILGTGAMFLSMKLHEKWKGK